MVLLGVRINLIPNKTVLQDQRINLKLKEMILFGQRINLKPNQTVLLGVRINLKPNKTVLLAKRINLKLKECLNLDHNLRSNRALRVEIKRRFTKFGDNMFESIGAKLINKIDILNCFLGNLIILLF